jgi:hypothetical protein
MVNETLVTPFADRPEMMAAADAMYESMFDVRRLLGTSALGRRVLAYGSDVMDEMARIVAEDPELGSRLFQTGMKAMSFARAMERERLRPGSTAPERRFLHEDYALGASVAEDMRARTKDPALVAALDDLQTEAARFVGLSPAEALQAVADETTPA